MSNKSTLRRALKRLNKAITDLFEAIEAAPLTLGGFATAFFAIIIVRILIELGTNLFGSEPLNYMLYEFSHTFLFFLFAFLLFLPVARLAGATSWSRATNLLLAGFLIIWTPPIIDKMIFGDQAFWSFYQLDGLSGLFSGFFHFFGGRPDIGITYGVRFEVAAMSIALGLYSLFRTRKPLRSVGIVFLSYLVFYILGTFPSYIAIGALASRQGLFHVTGADIAGYMLSTKKFFGMEMADPRMSLGYRMSLVYAILSVLSVGILLFHSFRKTFLALLGNVRWPQVFWHGGLLLLGGCLAMIYAGAEPDFRLFEILSVIVMVIAVESAWLASVIGNDLTDRHIDAITNPSRPLPVRSISEYRYRHIGILFFFTSILFSSIVSIKSMLFLLAYQAIAWIYSMPPLRLKRIPVVATALSAAAGIAVMLAGYSVIAPVPTISPVPLPLLAFLFVCYAATIPLKDFKDMKGDRQDGVFTIPVILGEEKARLFLGSVLFACYVGSPIALHDAGLFLPAFLFGSLAFMSIRRAGKKSSRWGSFRSLPAWNMLFIALYGICVALILLS
ncbi:MAG: UbiA family prenyltransferase [Candidatus Moranbacteria bacterium]|nr:UbiA family prenyltransferase [Candidatus Moranbacteria bacterium]